MRTTLTLDPDVAALLERVRRARKARLRTIVNDALRQGLAMMLSRPRRKEPYRTQPVDLGMCLIGSVDDVAEALALGEGESYK